MGLYDAWSPGGGAGRRVTHPTYVPSIILGYLLTSPFGGDGWFVRVDSLEDVVGGHAAVVVICVLGGLWHQLSSTLSWAQLAFVWSGEAYLSYSLAAVSLMGFIAC